MARSCLAASNRCWPWAAPWCSIRACCYSIIVEQHPQAVLAISDSALVLDHGEIAHQSSAQALQGDPELLERLLGVAR